MYLTEYQGDLFMAQTQTVVNTVNTVGVMGKGIALQFKIRYPKMFIKYKSFVMLIRFIPDSSGCINAQTVNLMF